MDTQSATTQTMPPPPAEPPPESPIAHRSNKITIWVFTLVLIVTGVAIVLNGQQSQDIRGRAALTGVSLALSPSVKSGTVGETFALGMTINTNSATVSAAEVHLTYDPTAIQILGFTPGTPLPVVLTPETHTNGTINVTLGAQPTSPYTGANILGTWTVKILKATQSSVRFASASAVAAFDQTGNVLLPTTESTITGR